MSFIVEFPVFKKYFVLYELKILNFDRKKSVLRLII